MERKVVIAGSGKVMLINEEGRVRLPLLSEVGIAIGAETFVMDGYTAVAQSDVTVFPENMETRGLRENWQLLPAEDYTAASKGMELLNWNAAERFCAACGAPLNRVDEICKRCPDCGREYFPRLNPAIVVLVTRGEEALLVHSRSLRGDVHALVAGFVETGETLEECVAREIREETSLEVSDIRYVGSQAWPYPYQLMMGFTARYESGEVVFADGELTSGGFFSRENVPEIPAPPSLSRKIIDCWLKGEMPERNH